MRTSGAIAIAALLAATGCLTRAGGGLPTLQPTPARGGGTLEYTVGDFEFSLEGGKLITSNKAGRELNEELLRRWKQNGYISDFSYVPSSAFTGTTDYKLTLSGSQYGDSSIVAQIFSGLTLLIIPYTVNTSYDVQYTLENARTGEKFASAVADSFHSTIELFLVFAAPVSRRGFDATMDAMSAHLYQQLADKGAFAAALAPQP